METELNQQFQGRVLRRIKMAGGQQSPTLTKLAGLPTVCEESSCPNQAECFASGVATLLIMGRICTRNCTYCHVACGRPDPLDEGEAEQVSRAATRLQTRHLVLTTVSRDDLRDGGAGHINNIASYLKGQHPGMRLEVLLPDFKGNRASWQTAAEAEIDLYSHNIELVPRFFPEMRPQGDFERSLDFLAYLASRGLLVKSGFMVGFGETEQEVYDLLLLLRRQGVSVVTIGQYLPPTAKHPPAKIVSEKSFARFGQWGRELDFAWVFSAPFVRSSYLAHKIWQNLPVS